MKIARVALTFIILFSFNSRLSTMDFLNDPFFQNLAKELDTMFADSGTDKEPAPTKQTAAKPAAGFFDGERPGVAGAAAAEKTIPDSAKDLKTLFLENLPPPKKEDTKSFGKTVESKVIISTERMKAYNHYMDALVKKSRLLERCIASNPGRVFGHPFLVFFDKIIDSIDQIDESNSLVLSKKLYRQAFFSQPMQKTRELIVTTLPKLDGMLREIRPLLVLEESLEEDIAALQQAAAEKKSKKTYKPAPALQRRRTRTPAVAAKGVVS